ncbi:hypothetical protein KCP70_25265 [Salmonella enterica subsp. enterica]|nr:hypothetical protein KCP70_25265 [Salmonella enterica subsp. enterica]
MHHAPTFLPKVLRRGRPESRRGFALTIASKHDNNTALPVPRGDTGVNPIFYLLLALLITFSSPLGDSSSYPVGRQRSCRFYGDCRRP